MLLIEPVGEVSHSACSPLRLPKERVGRFDNCKQEKLRWSLWFSYTIYFARLRTAAALMSLSSITHTHTNQILLVQICPACSQMSSCSPSFECTDLFSAHSVLYLALPHCLPWDGRRVPKVWVKKQTCEVINISFAHSHTHRVCFISLKFQFTQQEPLCSSQIHPPL